MTDFVVPQQLQINALKSKKTRRKVPQSPKTFEKLAILLYKVLLVQDCFFSGYELVSIPSREMYSLSVISLLLLSSTSFGLILLFIKVKSRLTIFSISTGEIIQPKLVFGLMAVMPMLILPIFNPSVLSEVVKYRIYSGSSAIVVCCLNQNRTSKFS